MPKILKYSVLGFNKYRRLSVIDLQTLKEEAEWFGLTLRQAIQKQRLIEEDIKPIPLKHELRLKFIEQLKRLLHYLEDWKKSENLKIDQKSQGISYSDPPKSKSESGYQKEEAGQTEESVEEK
ncbi:uncharacterized protein LOC118202141 [Stegodyphus dumicola]|uniref:uncharacterized protein LOC118202141 n=1 Tax=Stegodyphus dumicola TaxID=202533 RepID=UPI0015AEB266|nr:uncharacterized protein LOC118202141 [Stegodyphus dumicola]